MPMSMPSSSDEVPMSAGSVPALAPAPAPAASPWTCCRGGAPDGVGMRPAPRAKHAHAFGDAAFVEEEEPRDAYCVGRQA